MFSLRFPSLARLTLIAAVLVAISTLSVSAEDTTVSTVTCDIAQYLDSTTNECVTYSSRGEKAGNAYDTTIDSGNTAWMLMSSALVMLMTPGVAFFYAGLAGEDMASNTMMMSFVSMALVSIQFWAFGYSACFSSDGILLGPDAVCDDHTGTDQRRNRWTHEVWQLPPVYFAVDVDCLRHTCSLDVVAQVGREWGDNCNGLGGGAMAGLGAITPGCAYVYPSAAIVFGVVGTVAGFGAVHFKNTLRYDDTLDSFAIHGCGGFVGGLLTGLFATSDVNPTIEGGAFYGNGMQFFHQLVSQFSEENEINGMDVSYHGGKAYDSTDAAPRTKASSPPADDFMAMATPFKPNDADVA
ncbi:unnamed protein product [Phytophthora lilii]|uniref:Unnamed protein product n=1 Tax=Phytophthora lilii TaxID=2077276 RepID=A0A9W6THA7_9STRA|nr:unnamed protein product [Phytophthora lilii]